jgi:hypothetical protein
LPSIVIHPAPDASGTGVDAANGRSSQVQPSATVTAGGALPELDVGLGPPPRPQLHAIAIVATQAFTRAL